MARQPASQSRAVHNGERPLVRTSDAATGGDCQPQDAASCTQGLSCISAAGPRRHGDAQLHRRSERPDERARQPVRHGDAAARPADGHVHGRAGAAAGPDAAWLSPYSSNS